MAVVIVIMAVVGAVVFLNHRGRAPYRQLERATVQAMAAMREARMRAVGEDVPVTVSLLTNALTFRIWGDTNTNGVADPEECQEVVLGPAAGLAMTATATAGVFNAQGAFSASGGTWELQLFLDGAGRRFVRVAPAGQIDWSDLAP